jgi:outer membrane protein OmpA-like peptidoglycan-associated protein
MYPHRIWLKLPIWLIVFLTGCVSIPSKENGSENNFEKSKSSAISYAETTEGVAIRTQSRVFFETGKSDINPRSNEILDHLAKILVTDIKLSKVKARVDGHTDNVGNEKLNYDLSEARALKVMKELANRGVDIKRLNYQGHGSTKPIMSNDTADGRQLNRRTEVLLVGVKIKDIEGSLSFLDSLNEKFSKLVSNINDAIKSLFK